MEYGKYNPTYDDVSGWLWSEKFDGVRAEWTGSQLISKAGKPIKAPEWFIDKMPLGVKIIGELWLGYNSLEEVAGMVKRGAADSRWSNVEFKIFDAPEDFTGYEFISMVEWQEVNNIASHLDSVTKKSGEGIILLSPDRSLALKHKPRHDTEGEIICVNEKSRMATISSLGVEFKLRVPRNANPAIGDSVTYSYTSLTSSGVPREAVWKIIRDYDAA